MFRATCANCGKECEVPFKPNGRKPVLCSACFDKAGNRETDRFGGGDRGRRSSFEGNRHTSRPRNNDEQLDAINAKLDKILKLLSQK